MRITRSTKNERAIRRIMGKFTHVNLPYISEKRAEGFKSFSVYTEGNFVCIQIISKGYICHTIYEGQIYAE